MNEQVNLYIRLEKPNNEYDNGRLVFESSLNMSLNFRVFTVNPAYSRFKNQVYLELTAEMSQAKKWLVDKLSLKVIAGNDAVVSEFNEVLATVAGHKAEEFAGLNPVEAWMSLNKLVNDSLPYGAVWTDKQYFPTRPTEREGFKCSCSENRWTFKEDASFSDLIFEVKIDEYGRPIFQFRPEKEGWPATMECLLTELEHFLFTNRNSTGEWLLNTIFPEARKESDK